MNTSAITPGLRVAVFYTAVLLFFCPSSSNAQDMFEPDNAFDQATFTTLTTHTFHQPTDDDWFAFFLPQQQPLRVTPMAGMPVVAGSGTGIVGEIFRRGDDGRALFEAVIFAQTDSGEIIGFGDYMPPEDGFYYLRLRPCTGADSPACEGISFPPGGANYQVDLPFTFFGSNGTGRLSGSVTDDQTGQPVFFAIVSTSGNTGTFSNRGGAYTLVDAIGSYTATFTAAGYNSQTVSFELIEFNTTTVDVTLTSDLSFFRDSFENLSQ